MSKILRVQYNRTQSCMIFGCTDVNVLRLHFVSSLSVEDVGIDHVEKQIKIATQMLYLTSRHV